MRYLQTFAIAVPLTAALMFAQDPSQRPSSQSSESSSQKSKSRSSSQTEDRTTPAQSDRNSSRTERTAGQSDVAGQSFMGTIVDANCSQASSLMGSATSTTTPSETKSSGTKSHASAKKDVLRHCHPTASTTTFAILTDDGDFYKLDDTGNSKVTELGGAKKSMKVTANGTLEGDTLKIQSLSKR